MIHHFSFRARARRPGSRGGGEAPAHAPGSSQRSGPGFGSGPGSGSGPAPDPGIGPGPDSDSGGIVHVLMALIGREVTLVTDGGLRSGKLLRANPVTLTGPGGEAICLSPAQVRSVEF